MPSNPTAQPCVWNDDLHLHSAQSIGDSSEASSSLRITPALPPAERFLSQEPAPHLDLKPQNPDATPAKESSQLNRVLIVEDDKDNLFYAECAVEEFGYQWASTSSGHMTLPLALAYQPDIILLDIWLEETNGFDVLCHLRQHSQTAHIPTIAVTALSMPRELNQIAAAGFTGYLIKPYLLEELGRLLELHQPSSMQDSEKLI